MSFPELISETSIFRCMPSMLPPGFRRLLGGFACAVDGAELSYSRLRATALSFGQPASKADFASRESRAANRVSLFMDAWSLVDCISRARKAISCFPWDQSKLDRQLRDFIRDTGSAAAVRRRRHELDESWWTNGETKEPPLLGSLSWLDTRRAGSQTRYTIWSGPSSETDEARAFCPDAAAPGADVSQFCLTVGEGKADLDALHDTLKQFAARLETSIGSSVRQALLAEAKRQNLPVEKFQGNPAADTMIAARLEPHDRTADGWQVREFHRLIEVLPNSYGHRSMLAD